MFDIFNDDAFSVTSLTLAMREVKYRPSRIGQLGLFQPDSIDTLSFAIEKDTDGSMVLVPASPRGAPGQTIQGTKRSMRSLTVPHFQRDDAIYADEIQGVRAFGSEVARDTMISKIARKAQRHAQHFALTEEYHRLNIIKSGNLLDADGSVLYNYFTEFGESQPAEVDFDLDAASPADGALREKCAEIHEAMGTALDGLPYTGIRAMVGGTFFKQLIKHKEVRETYKYQEGSRLRSGFVNNGADANSSGILSSFEFGDITWEWYKGGSNVGVEQTKAHFVPEGVPDLFKTVYAPADYMETVNRPGQRMYAMQWDMPNKKGVNVEFQMNALHYCSRPRLLLRGRNT